MTFSDFFITKNCTIKDTINSKVSSFPHPTNIPDLPITGTQFDQFPSVTPTELLKLINKSSNKSSSMDFIPTSLIKSCSTVFLDKISNLANLPISQGSFPLKFKLAQVTPLLKKLGLNKNTPSNYHQAMLTCIQGTTWVSTSLHKKITVSKSHQHSASGHHHTIATSFLHLLTQFCSFAVGGPSLWNHLQDNVKKARSIELFKQRLKTYLFRQSFEIPAFT